MSEPREQAAAAPAPRFAATKIQPALPRAQRIERPALEQALLQATHERRVVLLQAPAGYGKTSALAALAGRLAAQGSALAWVSLDADDDAARLLACLAAALEPCDLPWRTLPDALVAQMHQGPAAARRAVEELLNALTHAGVPHGVIVLEDLHRVRNPDLAALGDLLLERLPRPWCLVLSSREVPALALARLRAAGELAEFGPEALRFSPEESARLLADAGLGAPGASGASGGASGAPGAEGREAAEGAGAALHERTQGWPAGLALALLAQRSRPGLAARALGERYLFEYLASEVMDALPAGLHAFLLRSSVLPELTAARAAQVSGDRQAAHWLQEIERRALFATPLDAEEPTLVLHDLFREALQARLRRRLPEEWPRLLQRAAAGESDPLRRVGFLLQAEDWAGAEQALDEAAPALFLHHGPGEVEQLLPQFDPTWRARSVVLAALAANAALLRWDWDGVAQHAAQAAALPEPAAGEAPHERLARQQTQALHAMALYVADRNAESEALIERMHAQPLLPRARRMMLIADATQHFRRGQHAQVQRLYGEVVDSLQQGASLFEWWECVPAANWSTLPGMRPLMQRYVDGATQQLQNQPLALRADIHMLQAYSHLWAGRVAAARASAAAAEDDQRWLACSGETDITLQIFRLLEGTISGRADEVRARLEALRGRNADATPQRRRLWQHHLAVYGVRVSHALGEPPAVLERWAEWLKEDPLRSDAHQNGRALAVRARHAVAAGRWGEARQHFERLLPLLPTMDVNAHASELQLRAAQVCLACGDAPTAAAIAAPTLQRMREEASPGYALMAGPALLQALAGALAGHLPVADLQTLEQALALAREARAGVVTERAAGGLALDAAAPLAARRAEGPGPGPDAAAAPAAAGDVAAPGAGAGGAGGLGVVGGLSAREAEVLALMARGQSNKVIARTLDISPHTVKRHVANILDKLVVQTRGQAAAWWFGRVGGANSG